MKKKFSRILGVVLTLVLLSSLAIVSTPVSAGTQVWTTEPIPSATGIVLNAGNGWIGPMVMAGDGTLYAGIQGIDNDNDGLLNEDPVDTVDNDGDTLIDEDPAESQLVQSIDSGRTWTSLANFPAISGPAITDIVVSSVNDNTVYVTDGIDIWRTDDAGTTWSPRTNLIAFATTAGWTPLPVGLITSIDIGYIGGNSHIFAGVSSFGGGTGGVFVCYEWQFGMPWNDLGVDNNRPTPWAAFPPARSADVYDVRVDPNNFAVSQMVMAVATDTTAGITYVTHHYDGAQWNSFMAGDAALNVDNAAPVAVPVTTPYRAQLWLPGNFDSNLASGLMEYYVSIAEMPPVLPATPSEGDVYWILGSTVAAGSTAIDLNVRGVGNPTDVTGLDGIGNVGTATLMAGGDPGTGNPNVYTSINNGATWTPNTKRPTGATSFFTAEASVVMLSATDALVATSGADCGVSLTSDGGAIFNTISLVATLFIWIDDMESGSLFITPWNTAGQEVWRKNGNWERVFSNSIYPTANGPFYLIDATPPGAPTPAVFLVELGGTTIPSIWRSLNNGQTWANLLSAAPGAINSFVAIDANTVLVGGAGVVYQTTTSGAIWFTRPCAIGTVQSFDVASNGDILAGSASAGVGRVALSTDNGITWSVATQTIAAIDTNLIVAFGSSYATTGEMYATGTDTGGDAGVWKRTTGAWSQIDRILANAQSGTDDVRQGTGLVSAPGISGVDMVYAADGSATTEGVYRIKANRTEGEQMAGPANTTFWGLWAGSNTLYTLDRNGAGIGVYTFTDTLAVVVSGVAVSAITPTTATVTWTALTNATNYLVVVNTTAQTNFYMAVNSAGVLVNGVNAPSAAITANTAAITGLIPGVVYNVSVWSWATESSFLGGDTFTTLSVAVGGPVSLVPANGAINIPVLGPAFAWSPPAVGGVPVAGITGYKFDLTKDPTFATITEGSASPTVPYLVWPEALEYETAYYWRVCAVTAAGDSAWVTSVFTTVAEPEPPVTVEPAPTPTIILPTPTVTVIPPDVVVTVVPPDITVNIPTPTITTVQTTIEMPEEITPAYIWAIVAIGALLVIAVIILIIRTRRVV